MYVYHKGSDLPVPSGPIPSLGAQDVKPLIPEAVGMSGDQLTLGTGPIIYALVNAVQELAQEVATLRSE
jgi:hypothetical protein